MIDGRKIKQLVQFGVLALVLALGLTACDLTGDDVGLVNGDAASEVSELGIVWTGDEFELVGTVSELGQEHAALTVSYPGDDGTEETVLVAVPGGLLTPAALGEGDLVLIRGTLDEAGVLTASEIERIEPRGMVPGGM